MDQATQKPCGPPEDSHLYVGNLSPRVTEYMLTETFAVTGPVQHVKIIPDRNYQHGGLNYALVKYFDMRSAQTAVQILNGRKFFDTEIQVSWANQIQQNTIDATGQYRVLVGNLSPEVNNEVLRRAFSAFGSLSDARAMSDLHSGKSRGYGFLVFHDKTDAEQAIATMNGEWLGSHAVTVSWPDQNPQERSRDSLSYESIVQQAPSDQTTFYVGNLVPYCTQADLIPLFQSVGYLNGIEMQADHGYASVRLDTHEHAAMAILQLQGQTVHGRPIQCGWQKSDDLRYGPQQVSDLHAPLQAPGMPPSNTPSQDNSDVSDPSSYYQNYWGGYYQGPPAER
ncbi:hypothetical protein BDV40DRAFT_304889 [Aspergillus tamarii]|uniref:RRM domain-containing protein n=1 Tax=Aspergillus tamarii TaxID=41984 RepID=A0A5N6UHP0_ASPTM|nr:hypothetical protein BDV40DRAFT_304889 [Aspergillus tamarii]